MPENIEALHRKKKRETLISSLFFTVMGLLSASVPVLIKIGFHLEGFWAAFLVSITLLDLGMVIPVWIHYNTRIKEIDGGEEDAAAQY